MPVPDTDPDEDARPAAAPVAVATVATVATVPVGVGHRAIVVLVHRRRARPVHHVLEHVVAQDVVIEIAAGNSLDELVEIGFRLVGDVHVIQRRVVPVVAGNVAFDLERIVGYRRVDRSVAGALVDRERFAVAAAGNLVLLAAADQRVIGRIEREQNPQPPVRIHVQYEEVPVLAGLDLDFDAVAPLIPSVIIQPDADGGVVLRSHRWARAAGRRGEDGRQQHERGEHWHLPTPYHLYDA